MEKEKFYEPHEIINGNIQIDMQKKYIALNLLILTAVLLLSGCNGRKEKGNKEGLPLITVTIEPQRYFTEAIAGDKFKVISMVPKGSNPETYDATPQQLVALSESKAYFRIGYIGFEQNWMDRLIHNAPHLQVYNLSDHINLIEGHAHCEHEHEHAIDPHIWNSTSNALIIAKNTLEALCTLDKNNESYYMQRYNKLCEEINKVDRLIREQLSRNGASHAFMIYHPALTYFARDYGLHQLTIEKDGKEPSPSHLESLIATCRKEQISILFIQPEFDKRHAEIIAEQSGLTLCPINPLSYNWKEEMIHIAKALSSNL